MNQPQGFEMPTPESFDMQMTELRHQMSQMHMVLADMAKAMSKLAVLEERNLVASQAIEKIATKVDKLDEKVTENEIKQVVFETKVESVSKTMKFMWGAFGSGVIYIGHELIKHYLT